MDTGKPTMDGGYHTESTLPAAGSTPVHMSAGRYLATRLSSLKPPMDHVRNPIALLRMLNFQQWMFFLVAFLGWTWDAFDFFTVSLTVRCVVHPPFETNDIFVPVS